MASFDSELEVERKANIAVYSSSGFTADNFRDFQNRLVENGVLNDKQLDQYHDNIHRLYRVWQTSLPAQPSERDERRPMGPRTPESLPPLAAPPKNFTSSSSGDARMATAVETVKEAVASIISDQRELPDALTGSLYLPSDMNHVTVPVTMKKSECSQSYIRVRTLEKNQIEWEGNDVILRWKSMAINGNEDQSVQHTCFNVVEEAVASREGFRFDMLVGVNHGLPLPEQIQALGAEETSSTGSSVIDRTDSLPAHAFEDSRNAELRPLPVTYGSPQPATATISFSGSSPGREMASFFNHLRDGTDVAFKPAESSAGRLIELPRHSSSKRKLSSSDNSGGASRKSRSFGRQSQR